MLLTGKLLKNNNNSGFTLIELVVVITILGILAATAVPKFVNLTGDAKSSALDGVRGSIVGVMNSVYAKALIEDKIASATGDTVAVTGGTVAIRFGYPDGTAAGIGASLDLDSVFSVSAGTDPEDPYRICYGTTCTGSTCYLDYTPSASANARPTTAKTDSGC